MAYLSQKLSDFTRNRNRLLTGEEEPQTGGATPLEPEYDLSSDIAFPQVSRRVAQPRVPDAWNRRAPTLGRPAPTSPTQAQAPTSLPLSSPTTQTTTSAPGTARGSGGAQTPPPAPTLPSFQRTGSLSSRLFSPLSTGAQGGQESLTGAANLFRQEAGPSRSYESTGAQEQLRQAYQTGAQPAMEAARGFVGARYEGPQGLDQQTTAGLQKLTEDLQARQKAMGSAGGLQTLIGQSVPGLTQGESLFEAKRQLPGAKVEARDLGFQQVNPLVSRLMEERRGAEAFAAQRTREEQDIAERSKGFLTGERGGITSAIQTLMDQRAAQQQGAEQAFAGLMGAPDARGRLEGLQDAAPFLRSGTMDAPGDLVGNAAADAFRTPGVTGGEEADALFRQIMADPRFAGIAEHDPLELTVTGRGKQFYGQDGQDLRGVVEDPALRKLLYERQGELEAAFDPLRGQARPFSRTPGEGGDLSAFKPLYGGEGFKPQDPANYLGFDPGIRPSRGNSSTEEQRDQFNRINDLLGELDRIGETDPFRAASIFADADKYLADEEAALEAHKGELTENAKEWVNQVKKLRKKYRKKARESEYGKIGAIVGNVVGLGDVGYIAGRELA